MPVCVAHRSGPETSLHAVETRVENPPTAPAACGQAGTVRTQHEPPFATRDRQQATGPVLVRRSVTLVEFLSNVAGGRITHTRSLLRMFDRGCWSGGGRPCRGFPHELRGNQARATADRRSASPEGTTRRSNHRAVQPRDIPAHLHPRRPQLPGVRPGFSARGRHPGGATLGLGAKRRRR